MFTSFHSSVFSGLIPNDFSLKNRVSRLQLHALNLSRKPNVNTNVGRKHMLNFSQVTAFSHYCNSSAVYHAQ